MTLRAGGHRDLVDLILDDNFCPVARMRLLSQGINRNNRILLDEQVVGDRACFACGNCVDACPVVKDKHRFVFLQNLRTSMSLENLVSEECRRCYSCIKACPQVDQELKECAAGFRRGEKMIHLLIALVIGSLASSGIVLAHYGDLLPASEIGFLALAHRGLGLTLVLIPFLYCVLDKKHLLRLLKRSFAWDKEDWHWIKQLMRHFGDHKRFPLPAMQEFHPAQKAWYLFIMLIMLPVLSITGLIMIFATGGAGPSSPVYVRSIHMIVALITDMLLFVHIYLKYLRKWALLIFDVMRVFVRRGHLNYSLLYRGDSPD